MRRSAQIVLLSAARFYAPVMALFAGALLAFRPAGSGVGFAAGLAFALMLALHVVVFGAAASRRALPPLLARLLLALGAIAAMSAAGVPRWIYASQLAEAGAFAATAGAASLILAALAGRAPSLRDEDW